MSILLKEQVVEVVFIAILNVCCVVVDAYYKDF